MPVRPLVPLLALLMFAAAPASATAQDAPKPAAAGWVKNPAYWPEPVMDHAPPILPALDAARSVLVFSKTNGFRDGPQIAEANAALETMLRARGWDAFVSENAAVFNREQLSRFDVVVLNSISGNVFTETQREAFRAWIEAGGGVVALHGSGGDSRYDWDWYVGTLLGAQFIGHTNAPKQFQQAVVLVDAVDHPAMRGLPRAWRRTDEWYAFDRVPAGHGTRILARLDEQSYAPEAAHRMGEHPVVWTRCIARGRVFYSALGHKAETYREPLHLQMIDGAIGWAAGTPRDRCE